jgi:hypothetical protein
MKNVPVRQYYQYHQYRQVLPAECERRDHQENKGLGEDYVLPLVELFMWAVCLMGGTALLRLFWSLMVLSFRITM